MDEDRTAQWFRANYLNFEPTETQAQVRLVGIPICPDLLDWTMLGVADTWRGRWVRILLRLAGRVK